MSRSERLLDLVQILRRRRRPVTGAALADELGVSLRTLYRDIATLQGQGAVICGEPGVGYILKPGYDLPPLMFSHDELEALVLGSRWVERRAEGTLALAARDVLAKISAVLPSELRERLEGSTLLVGPVRSAKTVAIDLTAVRRAVDAEHKLDLLYRDGEGAATRRVVWPFALGYFDDVRIVVAWCETRQAFRHFRADRMMEITDTLQRYPRRRHALLKDWRLQEGIAEDRS